jgi:hypothetical protein
VVAYLPFPPPVLDVIDKIDNIHIKYRSQRGSSIFAGTVRILDVYKEILDLGP